MRVEISKIVLVQEYAARWISAGMDKDEAVKEANRLFADLPDIVELKVLEEGKDN